MSKPLFKVQTLSVYISTTMVLLLLGIMCALFVAGNEVAKEMHDNMQISVVMNHEVEEGIILDLKSDMEQERYTGKIEYISAEQALQEEMKELGMNPAEQLGYNPYEASLEVTLKPEYNNTDSLEMIEEILLRNGNVKEVVYMKEVIGAVNESINKAGAAMLLLLVMLTLISWSQISNLVRLSIYSKRFLLHTMKLTGATWGFIRRPFIINNMLIGLFSSIAANAILALLLYGIGQSIPEATVYLPVEKLLVTGAIVTAFGILICGLCAFLSVNRFLRMRNNDLYFI